MNSEVSKICEEYRDALFYGKKKILNSLKPEIEKRLAGNAEYFFAESKKWLSRCQALIDEAVYCASNGVTRDTLEFDSLVKEASELGGNVNKCLCAAFDKVADENKFAFAFPKSWKQPISKKAGGGRPVFESTTAAECMYQYCFYGLQDSRELNMQTELDKYLQFGGSEENLKTDRAFADKWIAEGRNIMDELSSSEDVSPELQKRISQLGGPLWYRIKVLREKNAKRKEKINATRLHKAKIDPVSGTAPIPDVSSGVPKQCRKLSLAPSHPNDIAGLPPANKWFLYVDESYVVDKNDPEKSFGQNGDGVIGGVLFDAENPLPKQPQLHASQDGSEAKMTKADELIETVIHSSCGVLVLPAGACVAPQGWASMIGAYIDLVLRLLPLSEQISELDVFVERRDPYVTAKDCKLLQDACMFRLMQSLPERAGKIKLSISTQSKDDPYNAYPDIVSHCCRMRNHSFLARPRFKATQWAGSCFLNYPAAFLNQLFEDFYNGKKISKEDWCILLETESSSHNSYVAAVLTQIGDEAKSDVSYWREYLDFAVQHLDSKAINIFRLKSQLNWLKEYIPDKAEMPPRLRLLWLTAKLAEENHRGCVNTFPRQREEFMKLSEQLFEEDAPLVCNAALNLAVSYTDEFDFEGARRILAPWKDRRPEVPGLQYYGRLLSSFGQHEAFLGNQAAAIRFFEEAIAVFGRLSDKESAVGDISQTSAYLLTAMMDALPEGVERFREAAKNYFKKDVHAAAAELSRDDSDAMKYAHHVLLRYLSGPHAAREERDAYLAGRTEWKTGNGHPWEMIEFYRALLVDDEKERAARLDSAYDIAMEGSGTLHVIAAVIDGARLLLDPTREAVYLELVAKCRAEIPALGERGRILQEHIHEKYEPLELARLVLPFNFR